MSPATSTAAAESATTVNSPTVPTLAALPTRIAGIIYPINLAA